MQKTRQWAKAAAIRAIKTMAQTAGAMLPASACITEVNWKWVVGTAALAGIASILTSLKGLPEVDPAEDPDAYDNDVEPVTLEELDELDGQVEDPEDRPGALEEFDEPEDEGETSENAEG